jgi:cytochrome c peroxidase
VSTLGTTALSLCLAVSLLLSAPDADAQVVLADRCPPSFELRADGTCVLRTLYDFYASPEDHGGVQANLPVHRGGYTPQQIDLGRYLFFDPILSVNKDMSCASCHQPDKAFTDGRAQSLGALLSGEREVLKRSTPSLWNVGFFKKLMWDGRANSLETQAAMPLLAAEEMGNTREGVEAAVAASPQYLRLFKGAFDEAPSFENISRALAAFQSSLISLNSRYDRYAHGDDKALSTQEIRGYNAFRGFVGRCSQCHVPPSFSDSQLAVVGAPAGPQGYVDPGAGAFTDDADLTGAFRVPSLRNTTLTAPYFHSGQFDNLSSVLGFYNNTRGHVAPPSQKLNIHWHVHMVDGPKLSEQDLDDIVAFLGALEDQSMMPEVPDVLPSGVNKVNSLEGL